ncbi:putative nucleic acid-binding protein [Saccharopolyspora lacisalsi]|uniref:Putative nucleic acid-binding protein n=1 Tax=Halosaccharopolyspora lacisalsi TaxID=1000566 RepID=A0A839DW23_9PSEU|nr:type II toxin-antitoxin system VapC family toxin [Halosaccharopolyspora lacisalsi]MBA8822988.1 putative nucleic acid-binding protein [Halosaccharopolyspora lacisalsi]
MSPAVVDASVLTAFYVAGAPRPPQAVRRLSAGHALFAPARFDAEIVSALRGVAEGNAVLAEAVPGALRHLAGSSVRRVPVAPLMERMWGLRHNITACDAAYVALAEQWDADLITCDAKLAGSGGRCRFDVVE